MNESGQESNTANRVETSNQEPVATDPLQPVPDRQTLAVGAVPAESATSESAATETQAGDQWPHKDASCERELDDSARDHDAEDGDLADDEFDGVEPGDDEPDDDDPDDHEFADEEPADAEHDDEELLDRLREWLNEARRQSYELDESQRESADAQSPPDAQFGLYRLVEEFTALRHELKLQTKSARGLEEQSQTQLAGLRQAIEAFRSVEPNEALAVWSAGKGLATALADLDEALERGRTQMERSGRILIDEPTRGLPTALDDLFSRQSWFTRLFCNRYHRRIRELAASHGRQERQALFTALVEGYGLIQGRLARALAAERIERIATLGRPVDPERMIVVELVETSAQPPGVVVDEVRRGYTWNGRILRCAEVRAARSPSAGVPASVIQP